jgi:hypothetical protein
VTVYCLGDLMVDVVARLFGPLAEGSDSPAVIAYVGGGSAANTAAWLTRVGVDSVFVGAIGDDAAGQSQLESLHTLGVDVRFRVDRTRPTGTCLVLVAPTGERTMVPDPGANLALEEFDVPTDEFAPGDRRRHRTTVSHRLLELARQACVVGTREAVTDDRALERDDRPAVGQGVAHLVVHQHGVLRGSASAAHGPVERTSCQLEGFILPDAEGAHHVGIARSGLLGRAIAAVAVDHRAVAAARRHHAGVLELAIGACHGVGCDAEPRRQGATVGSFVPGGS